MEIVSAQEAVSIVKSNDRVFFQGAAMTPNMLIDTLCERYRDLKNVEIIQIHTHGEAKYTVAPYTEAFHLSSCFVGENVRKGVDTVHGDYIPVFLSGYIGYSEEIFCRWMSLSSRFHLQINTATAPWDYL